MDFKLQLMRDSRVSAVSYVTKEQALVRFQEMPTLSPDLIAALGSNPLPASLDVTVKDIRSLADIDKMVRTSPLVDKSPATNYSPDVIDKIIVLARVAGIAGVVLIVGLAALSLFIIMLTIRTAIYMRRKEIEVMKLVGATDWFVRWPFIVEGLMVGVLAQLRLIILMALVTSAVTMHSLLHLLVWIAFVHRVASDTGEFPFLIASALDQPVELPARDPDHAIGPKEVVHDVRIFGEDISQPGLFSQFADSDDWGGFFQVIARTIAKPVLPPTFAFRKPFHAVTKPADLG